MLTFRLIYERGYWIAECGDMRARAASLPELDKKLGKVLADMNPHSSGSKTAVLMTFDNSVIPQWMRQYSNHYFNRVVTIKLA